MLRIFKITAILEGISYLVLFSNMLFIKPTNLVLYKTLLYPIGMSHGVLFIGYVLLAILLKNAQKWDFKTFGIILIASLLPFGTFYIENGEIKFPVKNFRFNESPVIMLNNLDEIGKSERTVSGESNQNYLLPPLKIRDFTFTSLSDAV